MPSLTIRLMFCFAWTPETMSRVATEVLERGSITSRPHFRATHTDTHTQSDQGGAIAALHPHHLICLYGMLVAQKRAAIGVS